MSKVSIPNRYFRARLIENGKPVFVWDFANFCLFSNFYQTVKRAEINTNGAAINFYLCYASEDKEIFLDSFLINVNAYEMINFDHPRRVAKTGCNPPKCCFEKKGDVNED